MAESSIQITQGTGTNIDVAYPGGASTARQVVSIGDPTATLAGIANVSNGYLSAAAAQAGVWSVGLAANSSITAFQGTNPWLSNVSLVGTSTVVQAAGSTLTAYQGGSPWGVNASIAGSVSVTGAFYQANQPVTASIVGTVPVSGAFNVSLTGGVSLVGTPTVNASIQGTVPVSGFLTAMNVSLVGTPTANVSIQGTVPVSGFLTSMNVSLVGITAVNVSLLAPATVTLAGAVKVVGNAGAIVDGVITAATAPANMVATGGVYNSSAPVLTTGQSAAVQLDAAGNEKVYLATKLDSANDSITEYAGGNSYLNIAAGQATTVVKASAGVLQIGRASCRERV